MASDAVSSVAYAVEEILYALVPFIGILAVRYVGLVSIPIILLLVILVFSYSQIITKYPKGGGAYDVSKDVFGKKTSLAAASCLMVDYILTAAVSVSSSTAAIVAAFPELASNKIIISIACILLITLINLRGASESSKIFGFPTYLFILSMVVLIITGFIRYFTGNLPPIEYAFPPEQLEGITLLLFLKAFSSGCTALTGVEAVSNAVPNFREPPVKTAKHVLYMLGMIIIFIFGGTSFLAGVIKVIPVENTTVISQMAHQIFGGGFMYYALQFTTALILLLAANTAYNGLPVLLSILAHDQYIPKQFSHRGAKLSFSNGIILISVISIVLLITFKADTHALIPFYAVGVLVSFTISQAGMFLKWLKIKGKGWVYKSCINGFGALATFVGAIIVFAMKFASGAWVIAIIIPLIMLFMAFTRREYVKFEKDVSIENYDYKYKGNKSNNTKPCIVLVHNMNKGTLKTLDYALDISSNITALHISRTLSHTKLLQKQWDEMKIDIPLTVIPAPHREIMQPLIDYITEREKQLNKSEHLTVVLTKYIGDWKYRIFHNQTSLFIENRLSGHKDSVTVLVPYVYSEKKNMKI
ncbi:MAG: APC family permease [Oscillospiraceae bacterium]|nr:APC family permease [Oscillospiraceae bacterium]